MEEVLQSLTAGKIHELLVACGIGDCSNEPIKQHILAISNFGELSNRSLGKIVH
jgi:hypothetical protein